MVNVRVVVCTEPVAPVVLIPAVFAVNNVAPVAAVVVPLPLTTKVWKSVVASFAVLNVNAPVPKLRLEASCTVFVVVPLPEFHTIAPVIEPPDCVMVCVPVVLLKVIVVTPPPALEIVPPVCEKLPAILHVGVEVPLFRLMLPLMVQFPPMVKIGAAGLFELYVTEPVPAELRVKFPFIVVKRPSRLIATDWLAQFQVKLENA